MRGVKRRRVALALLLVSMVVGIRGCKPPPVVVLFVGDSLTTFPLGCDYPRLFYWHHGAKVVVRNAGSFGSTARGWLNTGKLERLLVLYRPRVVVIALGTNDVASGRRFPVIVQDLRTLYDRVEAGTDAHGRPARAYVATVPPIYDPPEGPRKKNGAAVRREIGALNTYLRMRFPRERIVDFDSWMPAAWSADVMESADDGVHISCGGHERRAERVVATVVP
jgi:lysophospholipase L1-like esterase